LDAYGFSARKDLLAQFMNLNRFVAAAEKAAEAVTAPGVPYFVWRSRATDQRRLHSALKEEDRGVTQRIDLARSM
jgi:hypothetical protein